MHNHENVNEYEIIKRVLEGDKDLFKVIVQNHYSKLFYYILPILNFHYQDSEDVVADTFTKAYLHLNKYNFTNKFSTWLYTIAYNTALDQIKKNKSKYTLPLEKALHKGFQPTKWHLEFDLQRVLHKLKPVDRSLLVMNYLQELTISEISDTLGINPQQVSLKLHRAKVRAQKIAQQLI